MNRCKTGGFDIRGEGREGREGKGVMGYYLYELKVSNAIVRTSDL